MMTRNLEHNFFLPVIENYSDIQIIISNSALQCHLAAAFYFKINVASFIFSDLSSDARTSSCLYFKRYIIYGQNSQSQVFQQNNLLKSCIGSLVKSENCNRTASPPELAHCAPLTDNHCAQKSLVERGAQWAKSGGEAFLLQFSDFTKDPMHDFNRLFC